MYVAVEEPGQDCRPGHVDDDVAVQSLPDVQDPAVGDHHVGEPWVRARAVEDLRAVQEDARCHARARGHSYAPTTTLFGSASALDAGS